jgi:colicin import membrane protein
MPRKLKTYITNLGFFELAIAAPSMKAALEAWGMSHNAFQHGFAKQTEDPETVAATNGQPGVVLKRAVGSSGRSKENAELPKSLPSIKPPQADTIGFKPRGRPKPLAKSKSSPKADRAAVISFEKERGRWQKEREGEESRLQKEREERRRATDKAEAVLDAAREAHKQTMAAIEAERAKLNRRAEKEIDRWEAQRKKLAAAVEPATK